jgi:hypothetical protein
MASSGDKGTGSFVGHGSGGGGGKVLIVLVCGYGGAPWQTCKPAKRTSVKSQVLLKYSTRPWRVICRRSCGGSDGTAGAPIVGASPVYHSRPRGPTSHSSSCPERFARQSSTVACAATGPAADAEASFHSSSAADAFCAESEENAGGLEAMLRRAARAAFRGTGGQEGRGTVIDDHNRSQFKKVQKHATVPSEDSDAFANHRLVIARTIDRRDTPVVGCFDLQCLKRFCFMMM